MSWLNQIGNLLQQYAGASGQPSPNAEADYDQFTRAAPRPAIAQGVADAFRSDQTPPFGQMVGQLFSQSSGGQRADLINTLAAALGPQVLSQVMGGSGLSGLLGGGRGISPEQADQLSPQAVEQLAERAERENPSVVDQVSGFFAQHPDLMKGLGAGALAAVLGGLGQRQARGEVLPSSEDPYGDPADQPYGQNVRPASEDPYGDPADQLQGAQVRPASEDPYGDPADDPRQR